MKFQVLMISILVGVISLFAYEDGSCQWSDLLKGVQNTVSSPDDTERKVANGLKEAIEIGIKNAITQVSNIGGYYKNPNIKIFLPDKIQKVDWVLRNAGYGPQLDQFELSMNRAAEAAAPKAEFIFMESIKQMTFKDAKDILHGSDDAATQYFRKNNEAKLAELFKPIIQNTMSEAEVTKWYQEIFTQVKHVPFVNLSGFSLDDYVTANALDGLFFMIAQQEKEIRNNPQARVTELLKEIF
jgi:hypothetical protein